MVRHGRPTAYRPVLQCIESVWDIGSILHLILIVCEIMQNVKLTSLFVNADSVCVEFVDKYLTSIAKLKVKLTPGRIATAHGRFNSIPQLR